MKNRFIIINRLIPAPLHPRHAALNAYKTGFTLIEMSVVLVVIGLIVGGVLVGQNLIHAAALRSQIKQLQDFQTAFNTFKVKYDCIPGDCANATTFFGTTDPAGNAINNGNGDGQIDTNVGKSTNGNAVYWTASTEMWGAFQQLAIAKMFAITPYNSAFPASAKLIPSINLNPSAAMWVGASYNFSGAGGNPDMTSHQTGTNVLWMTACNTPYIYTQTMNQWDDWCSIFVASDLQGIDAKIDDGLPTSGKFMGFGGYCGSSYSSYPCLLTSGTPYIYNTNNSSNTAYCQAAFVIN